MKVHLNEIANKQNKSLYSISKETGIAYSTIHKLSKGETDSIKFDTIKKLCECLSCQFDDIFDLID